MSLYLYTCDAEQHATYESYKARHEAVTDFKGREAYPLVTYAQWKARRQIAMSLELSTR